MPELLILQGFLFSVEVQKDQTLWSDERASDVLLLTFLSPYHTSSNSALSLSPLAKVGMFEPQPPPRQKDR